MSQTKIDFWQLRWESIQKRGMVGRSKAYGIGAGRTTRILEMAPAWHEKEWCRKEHVGYLLSGTLHVDFKSERSIDIEKGQGSRYQWEPRTKQAARRPLSCSSSTASQTEVSSGLTPELRPSIKISL